MRSRTEVARTTMGIGWFIGISFVHRGSLDIDRCTVTVPDISGECFGGNLLPYLRSGSWLAWNDWNGSSSIYWRLAIGTSVLRGQFFCSWKRPLPRRCWNCRDERQPEYYNFRIIISKNFRLRAAPTRVGRPVGKN